ncbi:hypothetical protein Tco_0921120 [Tanacetum coccineum]
MIDMAELVRLQICEELDDTWAWVAPRPERQLDVAVDALKVAESAPNVDEDAQAVLAPIQTPQPPPAVAQGALGELREVLDNMACDFSRFTTWTVTSLSWMMDHAGVRYTSYSDFQIPYVRRTRRRTDDAGTSIPQQPDP